MWVLLNKSLYNLNHVVSITLPKGGESFYYFTLYFKDGSSEKFVYSEWYKCKKRYEEILKSTNNYHHVTPMKPVLGIDLANNKKEKWGLPTEGVDNE